MMEARLLCLEERLTAGDHNRRVWSIVNGIGVPISQAQIPTAPRPLFAAADNTKEALLHYLTAEMAQPMFAVAEPGWTEWFVGELVKI